MVGGETGGRSWHVITKREQQTQFKWLAIVVFASRGKNQSKLKAMPFLTSFGLYLLVVNDLLYLLIASKQDEEERWVKPPLAVLDHVQT